jgi:3-dehydroquinate dehydratase/shikimate dehydrogenase
VAEVIASIIARSSDQVLRRARQAAMAGADWVELRLDVWPTSGDLRHLVEAIRLPVIATCRTRDDGGLFEGTLAQRRELFNRAMQAGVRGLDLEDWETWTPSMGQARLELLIRSHHCLTGVPKDLQGIRDRLFSLGGTVAKVVCTAHDLADAAPVLDLLASTDQTRRPTVAFAMGRTAWPTRVLACLMGAPFIYASVEEQEPTAPGQVPVDLLTGLYRVRELSGSTSIFGLLGNPALHSPGPWVHNRSYRSAGCDAIYLPLETSRPEAVTAMLPRRQLRGLSVTAPHKAAMAQQCHRLDSGAAAAGVVNTLTFEAHGMVVGHNTDVVGVQGALRRAGLSSAQEGEQGVVLGTGGGARGAAVALHQLGFGVTMLGRSLDSAREFTRHHGFRLGSLRADLIDELEPRVVVHSTPVGSAGRNQTQERVLPEWTPAPGTYVLDMVYKPVRTALLRDAETAEAVPVSGLEMFLTQAAAQIELFTGSRPQEDELRRYLAGVKTDPTRGEAGSARVSG